MNILNSLNFKLWSFIFKQLGFAFQHNFLCVAMIAEACLTD
jgi:hypothetical protein